MEENKSMCSFVRYESGVEGGMVRISEMRAFSNHPYHVEKDSGAAIRLLLGSWGRGSWFIL